MKRPDSQKISVIGIGRQGSGFVPGAFANAIHGLFDKERKGHEQLKLGNGHGAKDVTPSLAEIAQASAGKSPDDAYRQIVEHLFDRAGNNIALAKAGDGVTLVAHDEAAVVAGPIRSMAARHPGQRIASVSPCGPDHESNGCPVSVGTPVPLTAVAHYQDNSPFALDNSPRRQEAFAVNSHDALCLAPHFYPGNPSLGDVIEVLGELGPCFQYGFASLHLAPGRSKRFWGSLGKSLGGSYTPATGDLNDLLAQAAVCTELAHRPSALSTDNPIDFGLPRFVVYIAPFPQGEKFLEFIERQTVSLARAFPNARPVFCSGNGVPLLDAPKGSERFCQVTVVAPLRSPGSRSQPQ